MDGGIGLTHARVHRTCAPHVCTAEAGARTSAHRGRRIHCDCRLDPLPCASQRPRPWALGPTPRCPWQASTMGDHAGGSAATTAKRLRRQRLRRTSCRSSASLVSAYSGLHAPSSDHFRSIRPSRCLGPQKIRAVKSALEPEAGMRGCRATHAASSDHGRIARVGATVPLQLSLCQRPHPMAGPPPLHPRTHSPRRALVSLQQLQTGFDHCDDCEGCGGAPEALAPDGHGPPSLCLGLRLLGLCLPAESDFRPRPDLLGSAARGLFRRCFVSPVSKASVGLRLGWSDCSLGAGAAIGCERGCCEQVCFFFTCSRRYCVCMCAHGRAEIAAMSQLYRNSKDKRLTTTEWRLS